MKERLGQSGFRWVHPDDLSIATDTLAGLLSNPAGARAVELRWQHKSGSWRWILATVTNHLADPSIGAIVVNYSDITERKRGERQLTAIAQLSAALRGAASRADMLPIILREVTSLLNAEAAMLVLRDPLTGALKSHAATLPDIIREMLLTKYSERQGRLIDFDEEGSMETKKREGYF